MSERWYEPSWVVNFRQNLIQLIPKGMRILCQICWLMCLKHWSMFWIWFKYPSSVSLVWCFKWASRMLQACFMISSSIIQFVAASESWWRPQFYLPQPSEAYILHHLDHKLHPRKHMTSALVTQNLGNSFPLLVWYMFSKKMESKQLSSYSYLVPCSLLTASLVVPVVEEEPAVTVPCPHRCAISPRNCTQVFYFFGFYMSSFTCGLSQK